MKARGPVVARNLAGGIAVGLSLYCHGSAAFEAAAEAAHRATTLQVTNCGDSGTGSLRDAIASAVSGDTVDLSQLTCSTITLTSSFLSVLQDDLAITGPGAASLAIDGGNAVPVFAHYGLGTLTIDGLTLTNGYYSGNGSDYNRGGCVLSLGNVAIQNSVVSNCTIKGDHATGGAIFTFGNLSVVNSLITDNRAVGTLLAGSAAFRSVGDLAVQYSTISYNESSSPSAYAFAGCCHISGNVLIQNSTISGNRAKNFAGFLFSPQNNSPTALIVNSTISGNISEGGAYGAGATKTPLTIDNSTIAFNTGATVSGISAYNAPVVLRSSIVADNAGLDIYLYGTATVDGANNVVITSSVELPPDTIRACPQLEPLAGNGGATLTHMLRSTSPAIDMGSNETSALFDQRGSGYARVFGTSPDIGAVEWEGLADERIFNSGFESGCDE